MLDLVKIIVYARRIDPNYAKDDESAEGGPVVGKGAAGKALYTSFP